MFLLDFIIILSLIMLVSKSLIHQQKSQENISLNQANKGRVHEPRVRVQAEKIVDTYGRTRAAKRSLCDYHLSNDENKLQGKGWLIVVKTRISQQGRIRYDKSYFSPDGVHFTSIKQVKSKCRI